MAAIATISFLFAGAAGRFGTKWTLCTDTTEACVLPAGRAQPPRVPDLPSPKRSRRRLVKQHQTRFGARRPCGRDRHPVLVHRRRPGALPTPSTTNTTHRNSRRAVFRFVHPEARSDRNSNHAAPKRPARALALAQYGRQGNHSAPRRCRCGSPWSDVVAGSQARVNHRLVPSDCGHAGRSGRARAAPWTPSAARPIQPCHTRVKVR
jgi:hypothetical protein